MRKSVISIGESCFENCKNLKSISISNSVILIGEYCFYNYHELLSISIPNSVISIGLNKSS